jgi:hypothetical protein
MGQQRDRKRQAQKRRAEAARVTAKRQRLREDRREAARKAVEDGERRGCLFCRRSDGGFRSVEHIFPEGVGNQDLILPAGVVCDRCNHEVCSPLDAALCDFGPVAMMRTVHGIPSKRGKVPVFKFDNGSLSGGKPGELFLDLDSQKWSKPAVPAGDGRVQWGFTAKRHDMTAKRVAKVHRALVKMAVECAWLDLGEERLLSEEFDRERDIVMRGGHHGYLLLPKEGVPDEEVSLSYQQFTRNEDKHPLLFVLARFWGVQLVTDTLFPMPQGKDIPESFASVHPF